MIEDIPTISSFKELMNLISENWQYPRFTFSWVEPEMYRIKHLYIEPDKVTDENFTWYLADGVWEQFLQFIDFLENTEINNND